MEGCVSTALPRSAPFTRLAGRDWPEPVFEIDPVRKEALRIREADGPRGRLAKVAALRLWEQYGPEKARRAYDYAVNVEKLDRLEERAKRAEAEAAGKKRRDTAEKRSAAIREAALNAAALNLRPDVGADETLGVIATTDPHEEEELLKVGRGQPMRLRKRAPRRLRVVSLRDDPIGQMAKKHHLGNPAATDLRLLIAREYEARYELCQRGNLRAIDQTVEPVDGGAIHADISDAQLDALQWLERASRVLGKRNAELVRRVLGEKMNLTACADADGALGASKASNDQATYVYGQRLRESLDDLAVEFGLVTKGAKLRA